MLWFQKKNGDTDPTQLQAEEAFFGAAPADTAVDEGFGRQSCKK